MREVLLAVVIVGVGAAGCLNGGEPFAPDERPGSEEPAGGNESAQAASDPASDRAGERDDAGTGSPEQGSTDRADAQNASRDPAPTANEDANPWQVGLASFLETPDVALEASREDRRADVVHPGSPRFAAFDNTMEAFMEAYDVPAASVAVLHDGELRYERGYGHLDEAGTRETDARTMFRIASITKPMTAAVTTLMVEEGRLAWDDPVFCVPPDPEPDCLLPIEPHPDRPVVDERIGSIELRHLLEHQAGWSVDGPCNQPLWSSGAVEAARTLDVSTPPPAWRLGQWIMGAELARDPGDAEAYCNMGYVLLGLVAEATAGATLEAVYDAYLFRPLEISGEIQPGHTPPGERSEREPFYVCDEGRTQSVFDPDEQVCWADGGFHLQGILGAGGLISTASAVGAVFDRYTHDGQPRPEGGLWTSGFWGSLPGAASMVNTEVTPAHGEVQIVVVFNTRIGATPFDVYTPNLHWTQGVACASGYGAIRPYQCLMSDLMRDYTAVTDQL